MSSLEEVDVKIQRIKGFKTTYKEKHQELKVLLGLKYEEPDVENGKKTLFIITEELHNESKHNEERYKWQHANKQHQRRGKRRGLKDFWFMKLRPQSKVWRVYL